MVIYYDIKTKEIKRTEENTMTPELPFNKTLEEKREYYKKEGLEFVCLPYELGHYIFDYNLNFDQDGRFVGLQPKGRD